MARVSIYVPDDLKARMERIGEAANWSEVVRPAILFEVATHEHRKGANMSTVVERLKASKAKHIQESASFGREAGRAWASNNAEYAELVRVSKINAPGWTEDGWAYSELRAVVDPEKQLDNDELCACLGIDEADLNEEFLDGFIEGAKDVFMEVEDQL